MTITPADVKSKIKDNWLATNKGRTPLKIGERNKEFWFPGFWTIKHYSSDRIMMWIAIFFEIAFLLAIFTQAGLQLFLVLTASLSVITDIIAALAHNNKRKEITIARLELHNTKYLRTLNQVDDPAVREDEKELSKYENNVWRLIGTILLVISWLAKVLVTALTFGLPIFIFTSVVIFGFVAYIHLCLSPLKSWRRN